MNISKKLGKELARLRWANGYTVKRLSLETGINAWLIQMFEAGSQDMPLIEAMTLFDYFHQDFLKVYVALSKSAEHEDGGTNYAIGLQVAAVERKRVRWRVQSSKRSAQRTTAHARSLVKDCKDLQARARAVLATAVVW